MHLSADINYKAITRLTVLIILIPCLRGLCQSADSTEAVTLIGRWHVLSKIEIQKSDGKIIDQDEELYKKDEKFFDFTDKGELIITQAFGENTEKLPVRMQGNNLYIGNSKKHKIPYLIRYQGEVIKLAKTEKRTKKGKVIMKTEQVVLQRSKV